MPVLGCNRLFWLELPRGASCHEMAIDMSLSLALAGTFHHSTTVAVKWPQQSVGLSKYGCMTTTWLEGVADFAGICLVAACT